MFTSSVCVLKLKVQFSLQRKRFEKCAQNLTFHVGGAKAFRPCLRFVLQNVGGSEWDRSQKRLSGWRSKNWHGLHESIISRYTQRLHGTVTLISVPHNLKVTGSLHADTYTSIKRRFVDFSFHQKIGPHIKSCLQCALFLIALSYEVIRRGISKD